MMVVCPALFGWQPAALNRKYHGDMYRQRRLVHPHWRLVVAMGSPQPLKTPAGHLGHSSCGGHCGPMVRICSISIRSAIGAAGTFTEAAVLISLFSAVKCPCPSLSTPARAGAAGGGVDGSYRRAGRRPAYFALAAARRGDTIGAIVAPTDPVLATDVQIRHADDRDRLRYTHLRGGHDGRHFRLSGG